MRSSSNHRKFKATIEEKINLISLMRSYSVITLKQLY